MRDSQHGGQVGCDSDELSALARSVVSRIAARGRLGRVIADEALVQAILRAVTSGDPQAALEALQPDLRRARVSQTDLVDIYIPAVARQLGCNWADDSAGFAEVSMGMARLQALVHQLSRSWSSAEASAPDGATVLLVLPEGEQHSLGVQVLAGQMRRKGISVHIAMGQALPALHALVADRDFDCAMVSVACEDRVENCCKVVKCLRQGSNGRLWVAVGGAVLDRVADLAARTGADIATNDPLIALASSRQKSIVSRTDRQDDDTGMTASDTERLEEL